MCCHGKSQCKRGVRWMWEIHFYISFLTRHETSSMPVPVMKGENDCFAKPKSPKSWDTRTTTLQLLSHVWTATTMPGFHISAAIILYHLCVRRTMWILWNCAVPMVSGHREMVYIIRHHKRADYILHLVHYRTPLDQVCVWVCVTWCLGTGSGCGIAYKCFRFPRM